MKTKKLCFLVLIIFFFQNKLFSVQKGSETQVAVEPFAFFPSADSNNKMLSFGWFKNGFTLEDSSTTCTFASIFPVGGDVSLNGGTLYLDSDLYFSNNSTFTAFGTVYAYSQNVEYPFSMDILSDNNNVYRLRDVHLLTNSDFTLTGTLRFEGDCSFCAHGDIVTVGRGTSIVVGHDSTLFVSDAIFSGVCDGFIRCIDDTGKIIFQNLCFILSDNFTFSRGAFEIFECVRFRGGNYNFVYNTSLTSTIRNCGSLILDEGMTFSYAPGVARKDLLEFECKNARLLLNEATLYTTVTGMQLAKGLLVVTGNSNLYSEVVTGTWGSILGQPIRENGITFGNDLESQDFYCDLTGGSKLELLSGSLNYRNIGDSALHLMCQSKLQIDVGCRLKLYQSLNAGEGRVILQGGSRVLKASGKTIYGTVDSTGYVVYGNL